MPCTILHTARGNAQLSSQRFARLSSAPSASSFTTLDAALLAPNLGAAGMDRMKRSSP